MTLLVQGTGIIPHEGVCSGDMTLALKFDIVTKYDLRNDERHETDMASQ